MVASWEMVWRPTDRGTESTSGPLSGTTYTIHQLDPSTIYTLTVTATNVAGTNTSLPIIISTATGEFATSYPQDAGFEIAAGVVITLLAIATVAGMIVIMGFLYKSGRLHSIFKRIILNASKCLSSISRRNSEMQLPFMTSERETDPFRTTRNEAYNAEVVEQGGTEAGYDTPYRLSLSLTESVQVTKP
ncbi:hypothetical protein GBAR_LOCUS20965 [Geodia barretti]|uniref:Fibronectin type-III domain-containing protein n=1 Tax=Geodia barretti TaxID=519541 RepID=A0AA35SWN0_GEOBA|nr:hypothetical protein GBAR_LOCUS20965 [Geodia barretti]